ARVPGGAALELRGPRLGGVVELLAPGGRAVHAKGHELRGHVPAEAGAPGAAGPRELDLRDGRRGAVEVAAGEPARPAVLGEDARAAAGVPGAARGAGPALAGQEDHVARAKGLQRPGRRLEVAARLAPPGLLSDRASSFAKRPVLGEVPAIARDLRPVA